MLLAALLLAAADATAFVDVNVVPMTGAGPARATVLVEGDRIVAVGDVDVPDNAVVIDGTDRWLIPGLVDMHVHVDDAGDFIVYLAHGVTTVRNLSGAERHLRWQERIAAGELLAPTLHTTGWPIEGVDSAERAQQIVAEHVADGFDSLKIYDDVSPDAYLALVEEAHAAGLLAGGHTPRNLRLDAVLVARPDSIDHAEEFLYTWFAPELDREKIPDFVASMKEAGTAVVATLITYDMIERQARDLPSMMGQPEEAWVPYVDRRVWGPGKNSYEGRFDDIDELTRRLAFQKELVGALHEAGVRVMTGTDAGGVPFCFPGRSLLEEIEHLVDCGLSPREALAAATTEPAAFLGVADDVGTIAPGMRADLILLAADPLADVSALREREGVMVRGRWLTDEEFERRLVELTAAREVEREFLSFVIEEDVDDAPGKLAELGEIPGLERSLNELGYQFLYGPAHAKRRSAQVFALNVHLFPDSWNVWDSLGDALEALGRDDDAEAARSRSRELRQN